MGIILEAVIESEAPGIGSCRLFVDVVRTHAVTEAWPAQRLSENHRPT